MGNRENGDPADAGAGLAPPPDAFREDISQEEILDNCDKVLGIAKILAEAIRTALAHRMAIEEFELPEGLSARDALGRLAHHADAAEQQLSGAIDVLIDACFVAQREAILAASMPLKPEHVPTLPVPPRRPVKREVSQ